MKNYLSILFLILVSGSLMAQDFDNYQLLKGEGNIPQEFLTASTVKYQKAKLNIDQNAQKQRIEDQEKFYLESHFLIDDLLQSGKVLFNDPITKYINDVADELLSEDKELRSQIRFYAVRSTSVNAFATNQGIIFVNVGLVAQLETEAQLAFILAHEIAHVKHKHALDMYMESQSINRNTSRKDLVKQSSFDDRLIAKNFYSKELEISADKLGMDLYFDSKYKLADISGVFDVLQYSYLPFDVNKFDKSFLETEILQISEGYILTGEEVNPILVQEDTKDNPKSTHPSIAARRSVTEELIEDENDTDRKSYLVGNEKTFLSMRDVARFEMCYYYLHQFKYQEALYAVFLLSEKYPNSRYLQLIKIKSLYAYAKFENEIQGVKLKAQSNNIDNEILDSYDSRKSTYKKIEGELQQVYYMLSQMSPKELTVLATRHIWDGLVANPDDVELQHMQEDIFIDLAYHYDSYRSFSAKAKKQAIKKETIDSNQNKKTLSKYDKIKNSPTSKVKKIYNFSKYAFYDIARSKAFRKAFEKGQEEKKEIDKRIAYYNSEEGQDALEKENKKRYVALGLDSILVLPPYYAKVKEKKGEVNFLFLESEKRQSKLTEIIVSSAEIINLNIELFNIGDMTTAETQKFNDLRLLKEWISQQNRFGNSLLMNGFNQVAINDIIKRYNKKYVLFTAVVSNKAKRRNWAIWVILFDLEDGRYKILKNAYFKKKDSNPKVTAHIFDALFQIKSQSKN